MTNPEIPHPLPLPRFAGEGGLSTASLNDSAPLDGVGPPSPAKRGRGRGWGLTLAAFFVLTTTTFAARDKWQSLFDGKTLNGWERKAVHGGNGGLWEVQKGNIVGNQEPDHKGGLLGTTNATYGDYEVECEFQADSPADTGLFLRVQPDGNGYQVTIDHRPGGTIGDLYVPYGGGFVAQDKDWATKFKPKNWNKLKARIVGQPPRVTVWLNDKQTVDFTDTKTRLAPTGYIGLQVHGGGGSWGDASRARFRKIKIRPITPPASPEKKP